jgi:hypothetical protein
MPNPSETKTEGVAGWLFFLCIILTVLQPAYLIISLISAWSNQAILNRFPGFTVALAVGTVGDLALAGYSIYAGICLWSIRPNAVSVAKGYLLTMLAYSIVMPFLVIGLSDLPSYANNVMAAEGFKDFLRNLLGFGVWFSYLNVSKRVASTYGAGANHLPWGRRRRSRLSRPRTKLRGLFIRFPRASPTGTVGYAPMIGFFIPIRAEV